MKNCSNYRPISILPCLSKILEKIVNNQLQNYLKYNNSNSDWFTIWFLANQRLQSKDALIKFTNQAMSSLDYNLINTGKFVNFSKAFEIKNRYKHKYKYKYKQKYKYNN